MPSNILLLILVKIIVSATCNAPGTETTEVTATGPYDFRNVRMNPACSRVYCSKLPEDYPRELITTLIEKQNYSVTQARGIKYQGVSHQSTGQLCKVKKTNQRIYQIRDENNVVRYVAQSEKFEQIIGMEECSNPGEVLETNAPVDLEMLRSTSYKVVSAEFFYKFKFLVLSLDGKRLEIVRIGNRGVPVCCRCKIQYGEEH